MKLIELKKKLRKARDERGISQQSAAEFLGLPRTAITQMERGSRSISTLELTKLAKFYRYPISYFLDEISSDEKDINVILFRAAPNLNEATKDQIYHYIDLCKEGIALEKILDFEPRLSLPKYSLPFPKNKSEAVIQGTHIAEQERNRLNIGIGSISDITNLISNQGIWACSADLPDDISGLFLNNSKTGLIILVNANHVISRKRFSYAHEYAHALFDRDENIRISSTKNNSELIEVRANAFAAAFLIPSEGVNEILKNLNKGKSTRQAQVVFDVSADDKMNAESRSVPYSQNITFQDIAIIAHHFGVSYQAAVYRLRSLNKISQKESDQLIEKYQEGKNYLSLLHMSSDLESKERKELWDRELRAELSHLAIEAFRREEISRGRIIELGDAIGVGGKELYESALATQQDEQFLG
jgi:Zn-dependent peptidase ImmA (M78 family)/transcriptional regulator with XRE-family HTH domain